MLTRRWDNPILPGFIVFEGLDGAGTTTQAHRLTEHFVGTDRPAIFTCEPTDLPTGRVIRELIARDEPTQPWTLALLFAADRTEHLADPYNGIRAFLERGMRVVCDRYLFSSLAYQGAYADFSEVERLNHHFPLPEHIIFIDTPRDTAENRMRTRERRDSLERTEVQERVESVYREVIHDFADLRRTSVHIIDGSGTVDAIFGQIVALFDR